MIKCTFDFAVVAMVSHTWRLSRNPVDYVILVSSSRINMHIFRSGGEQQVISLVRAIAIHTTADRVVAGTAS